MPELPLWARDIKNAINACQLAENEAENELGAKHMDGSEGGLRSEYTKRGEKLLYEYLRMENKNTLPEKILLEKITAPQQNLSIGTNSGAINFVTQRPSAKYFLPREEAIYGVDYISNKNPEFDPENKNFVGFSGIETYDGNYSKPVDPNKLQTPLGIVKHQCKETSPWNWQLTLREIFIVVDTLKKHTTGTSLEASVTNLWEQMVKLNAEFKERVKERQIYHAETIKNRILQLKTAVAEQYKLPEYIEGSAVIGVRDGNDPYYKILITKTNELVRAPLRKTKRILREETMEPDMSKQQPSETLDWLKPGLYISLKYYIPKNIRDIIDAQLDPK